MPSAIAYPIADYAAAVSLMALVIASMALPVYLLFYRPTGGQSAWWLSEMAAITLLFVVTLPLLAAAAGIGEPIGLAGISAIALVQNALFLGLSAHVVMVRYGLPASRLGLRGEGWVGGTALGIAATAVSIPLSYAGEELAVYLIGLVEGRAAAAARATAEHLTDPLLPIVQSLTTALPAAWLAVLLVVIVPIGEEVFFRGIVYGGLRTRWGAGAAAVVSAAFFAVAHFQLVHGLPIFVLGLLLAYLYERTRSLVAAVVTHALNNAVALVAIWHGWGL